MLQNIKKPPTTDAYTLENLIDGLDERGILILQVLLGQQSMKLLAKDKVKEVVGEGVTEGKILLPTGQEIRNVLHA